ncbi:MAG: HAD family phosphatase [Muribaculaceae bacterium]|nr:HAD family phosphatase [Muribaculaceae bacterium]
MAIRNLLFDLGGVVVDIRRRNCVEAFERLGLPDADAHFGEYAQTGIFMALEDGSASVDEFHAALRQEFPNPEDISDAQIDDAFQKFIIGIPEERLRALVELRKRYRIYLLSNTNPIMWDGVLAREFDKLPPRRRADYFDGMVTSFEACAAKPDAAIFRYAERELGIRPEETLFFDDSQANVDAARALGFHAELVPPGTEFTDVLKSFEAARK